MIQLENHQKRGQKYNKVFVNCEPELRRLDDPLGEGGLEPAQHQHCRDHATHCGVWQNQGCQLDEWSKVF